jgi:uncharacterized repeat protein (TIGR03803 family)
MPDGTLSEFYAFCITLGNCTDGRFPSGLALGADGNFYGTTADGGEKGFGNFFKLTPDGTSYGMKAYQGKSYGGGADDERWQDRRHWGEQDGTYHPWDRPGGYGSLN